MRSSFLSYVALGLGIALVGCSATDSGYQGGELGNGGFYLSCDDAVACAPGTDDAKKFPKSVAVGSTFSIRFTNDSASGTNIVLTDATDSGITVDPIGTFVTRGVQGLSAQKVGVATIAAHDAAGQLIDYVNIEIDQPDALVIYDPDVPGDMISDTLDLSSGTQKNLRAFAQHKLTTLAGTLAIEWTSSDPSVVQVEELNGGEVTLAARKSGTATLTAVGGTFTRTVEATVQ